ncbi:MAG: resolvase [Akkermansiaceae bacterium]|nr:resolvase [Akkermansiaceae bacterium]
MTENKRLYVSYLRVSTRRQQESGLGLEAQRERVRQFTCQTGGELLAEFVETESGKKNDRKILNEALNYCRRSKTTLVLAKLDRLSRSVHFISGLMESKVDFIDIENPSKDPLWLHLRAVIGEHELRMISARTKDALRAAAARGVEIGATGKVLARRYRAEAQERAEEYRPVIAELRSLGLTTVRDTMAELNVRGVLSPGGTRWHYRATWKLLTRLREGVEGGGGTE